MSVDHFPFTPEHSPLRRPILQGTLAVGALTLALGHVLAQAGVPLYKLPRYALVIGNSSYANAPLVNPVNDARAIAGELLIRPDLSVNQAAYFTRASWKNFCTRSGDFSSVCICSVAAAFNLALVRTGTLV